MKKKTHGNIKWIEHNSLSYERFQDLPKDGCLTQNGGISLVQCEDNKSRIVKYGGIENNNKHVYILWENDNENENDDSDEIETDNDNNDNKNDNGNDDNNEDSNNDTMLNNDKQNEATKLKEKSNETTTTTTTNSKEGEKDEGEIVTENRGFNYKYNWYQLPQAWDLPCHSFMGKFANTFWVSFCLCLFFIVCFVLVVC